MILPPSCLVILFISSSLVWFGGRGWVDPTKRELAILPPDPSATSPIPVSALCVPVIVIQLMTQNHGYSLVNDFKSTEQPKHYWDLYKRVGI